MSASPLPSDNPNPIVTAMNHPILVRSYDRTSLQIAFSSKSVTDGRWLPKCQVESASLPPTPTLRLNFSLHLPSFQTAARPTLQTIKNSLPRSAAARSISGGSSFIDWRSWPSHRSSKAAAEINAAIAAAAPRRPPPPPPKGHFYRGRGPTPAQVFR